MKSPLRVHSETDYQLCQPLLCQPLLFQPEGNLRPPARRWKPSAQTVSLVIRWGTVVQFILTLLFIVQSTSLASPLAGQELASRRPSRSNPRIGQFQQHDVQNEIDQWLPVLADPLSTRAEMSEATEAILAAGPRILPRLREMSRSARLPMLEGLVQQLEERRLTEFVMPTTVQAGRSLTVDQVFELLERQTGNRLEWPRGREQQMEADWEQVDYWQAVDDAAGEFGLTFSPLPGELGVPKLIDAAGRLTPDGDRSIDRLVTYPGACRLELLRFNIQRDFRRESQSRVELELELRWEPRHQIYQVKIPNERLNLMNAAGERLELVADQPFRTMEVKPATTESIIRLKFELPNRLGEQLRLRGELEIGYLGPIEQVTIPISDAGTPAGERRFGEAIFSLDQVISETESSKLEATLRFEDAQQALESHRDWIFQNPVSLIDSNGNRYQPSRVEPIRQTANEVRLRLHFDADTPLDTCQLRYQTPSAVLTVPIPFEFREIRLP